jgi:hypothetical protein
MMDRYLIKTRWVAHDNSLGNDDSNPFIKIAQELHRKLWKKPFNAILSEYDVSSGKSFQYIPNQLIEDLQLYRLNYLENILLVREEYVTAFNTLESWAGSAGRGGGVVITGQPDIGV